MVAVAVVFARVVIVDDVLFHGFREGSASLHSLHVKLMKSLLNYISRYLITGQIFPEAIHPSVFAKDSTGCTYFEIINK